MFPNTLKVASHEEKGLVTIGCFFDCAVSAILIFEQVNDFIFTLFHWVVQNQYC